ncbi:MAG: choice-of-anchor B family protein [Saprospiraceae bacterium]|nr:choice-of-anchor B family protein [Saprospiraceae bacterium]
MKSIFQMVLPAVLAVWALPLFAQDYNIQLRSTLEFSNQTLANVCGYAQNGQEFALLGASGGLIIVDVTDPDNPAQIVQIPGPKNLWKEIKTYSHYAYVTTEGGGGVQIVDLKDLPSPNLQYHQYNGTGDVEGQLDEIHALHIDVTKGFLYTYGGTQSGAVAHDLNADPYNPTYVGRFDQLDYVHDGFADNDTLYACHISPNGVLSIVDMTDKANPVLLGSVDTPAKFTHNSWLLDDHKHILTTDERPPSFLTCYDISDPSDIRELDRISATYDGMNSIGHNTHVKNDWAITSWYTEGVTIVDAHRPTNLIQVGQYDTWPGTAPVTDGCWGVYPYLPSGNLIATNIPLINSDQPGKMFVLSPVYKRACYLEGQIKDACTQTPLIGADIKIESSDPLAFTKSTNDGTYKTGQVTPGSFTVTVSKFGYNTKTFTVVLKTAELTLLDIELEPESAYTVSAVVINENNNLPLANTQIILKNGPQEYQVQTDANGQFELNCVIGGAYRLGTWGYILSDLAVTGDKNYTINLQPVWYDDFELNLGWKATATADAGLWVREQPTATNFANQICNPGDDATLDNNTLCYLTGNAGGQPGTDDVDDGGVSLSSPAMQLGGYGDAVLSFWYWFFNDGGTGTPNDRFEVSVSNGLQSAVVFTEKNSQSLWRYSNDIHLAEFLPLTNNMQVQFRAFDDNPGHLVEAAVDIFQVVPSLVSTTIPASALPFSLLPNPSADGFWLSYAGQEEMPANTVLEVRNLLGQLLLTKILDTNSSQVFFGSELPKGVFLVNLRTDKRVSPPIRALKQ